jgi:pilus assembly protein CpaB
MTIPSDKTLRLERTKLTPQAPRGRNTTLIMALVAGVAAAALAYLFLARPPATTAPPPPPPMTPVVVATRKIDIRQPITPEMVRLVNMQPSKVTPSAATSFNAVLGQVSVNPIEKDAQIATTDVQPGTGLGLSFQVPPGMRAVTIALDPVSSVAGYVKPGDYVDIMCTFNGQQGQSITRTVLQKVYLMATGSQVLPTAAPPPTGSTVGSSQPPTNAANPDGAASKPIDVPNATVQVTPADAEKLFMAVSKGQMRLALRTPTDTNVDEVPVVKESSVTMMHPTATVAGAPAVKTKIVYVKVPAPIPPVSGLTPMPMPTPAPAPSPITVIRGSTATVVPVAP